MATCLCAYDLEANGARAEFTRNVVHALDRTCDGKGAEAICTGHREREQPSKPSPAVITSYPRDSSSILPTSRMVGSSSTMRIRYEKRLGTRRSAPDVARESNIIVSSVLTYPLTSGDEGAAVSSRVTASYGRKNVKTVPLHSLR